MIKVVFFISNVVFIRNLLFEIHTKITSTNSHFDNCWFLIDSDDSDKCIRRYSYKGDILIGITEYIKVVKLIQRSMNENRNRGQ